MSFLDALKQGVRGLGEGAKRQAIEATREAMIREFPGLSTEALKQGWIPIPGRVVESRLKAMIEGVDVVDQVRVAVANRCIELQVDTSAYGFVDNTLSMEVLCTEFVVSDERREAVLQVLNGVQVDAQSWAAKMVTGLAESIIVSALKSEKSAQQVAEQSAGILELDWPQVRVHLDRSEQLSAIVDRPLFKEFTILDALRFGPLEIHDNHLRLKVGWQKIDIAAIGSALLPERTEPKEA